MEEYLSCEEVKNLILRIKSGDNEAWESLYYNFEKYVHKYAQNRLKNLNMSENRKKDMEEELQHQEIDEYVILDDYQYDFEDFPKLWERWLITDGIENAAFASKTPAVEAILFREYIKELSQQNAVIK